MHQPPLVLTDHLVPAVAALVFVSPLHAARVLAHHLHEDSILHLMPTASWGDRT
jgi:hypothetical protein